MRKRPRRSTQAANIRYDESSSLSSFASSWSSSSVSLRRPLRGGKANQDQDQEEEEEDGAMKEELEAYEQWKRFSPLLYDEIYTQVLHWSSLCVQWFPPEENAEMRLLIGSYVEVGSGAQDYIAVLNLKEGENGLGKRSEIYNSVTHKNCVHRFRLMPQDERLCASMRMDGIIWVGDVLTRRNYGTRVPELLCKGHSNSYSYAISWNRSRKGHLLTGDGKNGSICLWDIGHASVHDDYVSPFHTFTPSGDRRDCVESVEWQDEHVFGSVSEKNAFRLWDTRSKTMIHQMNDIHQGSPRTMDFSSNGLLMVTGGDGGSILLWDARKLGSHVESFSFHQDTIQQVCWSPQRPDYFAACSTDEKVTIWKTSEPEPFFLHGGHQCSVASVAWHPTAPWTLASTDESTMLHVWTISRAIHQEELKDEVDGAAIA